MTMRKLRKLLFFTALFVIIIAIPALADAPPDPGGDPNTGGGTPVGGAPVGGGLIAMALYGALYGISKMRTFIKNHA